MRVCPPFLLVPMLCACQPVGPGIFGPTPLVAVSPDQKHVVIIVGNSGRSVDVETGADAAVLDDLDWQSPFGGFSADGSAFLTRTAVGHLLLTPASGGRPVDFGGALDMGQLSPDGSLLAVLRNLSQCGAEFYCADLVVLPARGGDGAVVVRGFRLVAGGPVGLYTWDQYQFAGNTRILFTNALGELRSVQVDGSAPVRIAESYRSDGGPGGGPLAGPLPPAWVVTPDGSRVVYSHASGVSVQPVAGGPATLLGTDPDARVPCGPSFQNQYASNPVCAFTLDGANVILQGLTARASYLTSVPLAGGAPMTLSPTSSGFSLGFLADGRYLFIGANYSYVFASIPGEIRTVPRNPEEFAWGSPSCVSPDGKWVAYLTGAVPGHSCNPCFTVRMVSTAGEASWTVSDANGPLRLAGLEPRADSSPVGFAPDSSSLVVIKRYGESDSPYPIGDLEMFPIGGGPGRLIAERVAYAMWADPRHVVYERYLGPIEPEIHVDRVR